MGKLKDDSKKSLAPEWAFEGYDLILCNNVKFILSLVLGTNFSQYFSIPLNKGTVMRNEAGENH